MALQSVSKSCSRFTPVVLHGLLSNGLLEDRIQGVISEFRRRISNATEKKSMGICRWYDEFVNLETIRSNYRTTTNVVLEAFDRLEPEEQDRYNRGIVLRGVMRQRHKSVAAKISNTPKQFSTSYHDYSPEKRWAIMRFIRRRIKADQPILSCCDIGRQYEVHETAVKRLIHDRLNSEEFERWQILVHLPKRSRVKRIANRGMNSSPRRISKGIIVDRQGPLTARGLERYSESQLARLRQLAVRNMEQKQAGECQIMSYRLLSKATGVSKEVIGQYLIHEMGVAWFLDRKSLAQSRKRIVDG